MNIVVLDGFTLNPGDLSSAALQALGPCEIYDRSAPGEVVPRAANAEIVLTNKTVVSREHIFALPKLQYIGVLATGYNIVDVSAARERKIPVCNVPAYGTKSVAQMTIALLLELTQRAGHYAATVREGRWSQSPDFCYWDYPLVELDGLTMGIVGYGQIGRAVGNLARAFGMKMIAAKRGRQSINLPPQLLRGEGEQSPDERVNFVDLETLFRASDVVSLHCPLTPETKHLISAERLALMKPTAFLLNTSRGPLIDEAALAATLNAGRIAGAGLDVLSVEPPVADNPLFRAKNCYITPHIAWATRAARGRLLETAIHNVEEFLRGKPVNVIN
jgi:glycerate dehydrogenase